MKNTLKKSLTIIAIIAISMSATANLRISGTIPIEEELRQDKEILINYMKIKEALFRDDFKEVKSIAVQMEEGLEDVKLSQAQFSSLKDVIANLAEAKDINAQRRYFAYLSEHLYQLAVKVDLTEKTLYLKSCPMAIEGQGAEWLSFQEEIRNPFMGQKMPSCGSVKEKTKK